MTAKGMERKLEKVVEPELVIGCPELCTAYLVDGKRPASAVRPRTAQQVAQVLALCAHEGWGVVPWGGGTQIGMGNVPHAFDVALDLSDLDEVEELDADNLTLVAGAGCALRSLRKRLQERGLFLPLDPPLSDKATLGGAFAANAFGPSRLRYGSARDLVLGLQAALTNGEVIDVGGKTVKNVAGYDLTRLFVGSFGTLGVITRVSCRLLPLPARSQTVAAGFADAEHAFAFVAQVLDSELLPTRLDLLLGDAGLGRAGAVATLVIGIDGSPETVERQARDFQALAGARGAAFADLLDEKTAESAGRLVRDLPAYTKSPLVVRAGLPLAAQGRYWAGAVQTLAGAPASGLLARAGLGFVYAWVEAEPARLLPLAEALRTLAGQLGGYAVFERLPADLKAQTDVWGPSRDDLLLMQALKAKFDPKGTLNAGRYIGRL